MQHRPTGRLAGGWSPSSWLARLRFWHRHEAEAVPEPAPQQAVGFAARYPLLAAAPKSIPPAPPDGAASGAAAAEAPPATQGAPAAQAAGSAPAAAPGAIETSGSVHTLETFAASLGSPAESGRPSGHADGTQLPLLGLESARGALTPAFLEALEDFWRARQSAAVSSRGPAFSPQAVLQAPTPRLPTRLPPVEEAAMPPLLAKTGHPSAQACWTAVKDGSLHLSDALSGPLEELFNPPGFAARDSGAILDWLQSMEADSAVELEESFAEVRRLSERLQAASLRAREAVSVAAWLYSARHRAEASDLRFLR